MAELYQGHLLPRAVWLGSLFHTGDSHCSCQELTIRECFSVWHQSRCLLIHQHSFSEVAQHLLVPTWGRPMADPQGEVLLGQQTLRDMSCTRMFCEVDRTPLCWGGSLGAHLKVHTLRPQIQNGGHCCSYLKEELELEIRWCSKLFVGNWNFSNKYHTWGVPHQSFYFRKPFALKSLFFMKREVSFNARVNPRDCCPVKLNQLRNSNVCFLYPVLHGLIYTFHFFLISSFWA